MRNLTAADLGLDIFCGAEPRRAETSHRPGTGGGDLADGRATAKDTQEALPAISGRVNSGSQTYERRNSAEMPTAPTNLRRAVSPVNPISEQGEITTADKSVEYLAELFNEEEQSDGPDPHDFEVESEMEQEARDGDR